MQSITFDPRPRVTRGWRTVDIVVAAVVAVAFGVVFWAWSQVYDAVSPVFNSIPPANGLLVGMWLVPGVLGGLIIRRPGAALFCELVASIVEMLLGNQWGTTNVLYGLFEGLAPELVFALFLYRRWGWPTALLAGAAAGRCRLPAGLVLLLPQLLDCVAFCLRRSGSGELCGHRWRRQLAARTGARGDRCPVGLRLGPRAGGGLVARVPGSSCAAGAGGMPVARHGPCAASTWSWSQASGCCCSVRQAPARAPCWPRLPGCLTLRQPASPRAP